jgi:hypothetical protein
MAYVSSPECPDQFWGPPSLLLFNRYCIYFLEAKRPERDADHSPPSVAEVKSEWSCTSAPPIRLHDEHRENFTFLYSSRSILRY